MQIHLETKDRVAIVKLSGNMIFDESLFVLRERVQSLLQSGMRRFVIDVSEVLHVDSSGCGEVIRIYTSLLKANGSLAFVNPTGRVRILWERIKLTEVLQIFDSMEAAQAFVLQGDAAQTG